MRVFVYGTLKRGFHNHHVMEGAGGEFLTDAFTLPMFSLRKAAIPFLEWGEDNVKGELFDVPEKELWRLDRLEGHPYFYVRIQAPVNWIGEYGDIVFDYAWMYFHRPKPNNPQTEEWL